MGKSGRKSGCRDRHENFFLKARVTGTTRGGWLGSIGRKKWAFRILAIDRRVGNVPSVSHAWKSAGITKNAIFMSRILFLFALFLLDRVMDYLEQRFLTFFFRRPQSCIARYVRDPSRNIQSSVLYY